MKKIVIFVQASRDIQHALAIYVRNKDTHAFKFYVVDHKNNYDYLLGLSLVNCEVKFIPNIPLKSLGNIFREKCRLPKLYELEFSKLKKASVYFFCNYFDFKTFYFVSKLSLSNKVVFYDHYKIERHIGMMPSLRGGVKICVVWFVTGLRLKVSSNEDILTYSWETYGIKKRFLEVQKSELREFIQPIEMQEKSVLFFDSNDQESKLYKNYASTLMSLVEFFRLRNYSIYVKPHPRLGMSDCLNKYPIKILDESIPMELMDLSNFDCVIGNATAALTSVYGQKKIFSFLLMLDFYDGEMKNQYHQYLTSLSPSINFIANENELGIMNNAYKNDFLE